MKHNLNLMSERARKQEQIRNCVRTWLRILSVVVVVLTVFGLFDYRDCRLKATDHELAEAEYEPTLQIKRENVRLRKEIEAIEQEEQLLLALSKEQPVISLLGLVTETVAKHEGDVYLQQLEIERTPLALEEQDLSTLRFAIQGMAKESVLATQFADSLREIGFFAEVQLDVKASTAKSNPARPTFSIECTN